MRKVKYPNIEAERARQGLTVNELAEELGISGNSYRNYFIDCTTEKIPYSIIKQLSRKYNCTLDYLMVERNDKDTNDRRSRPGAESQGPENIN